MKLVRKSTVDISTLKTTFFVRAALDQERVLQFAMLKEAGVKFPPIVIDEDGNIIDGRHRYEAELFLSATHVDVEVRSFNSEIDKIEFAFKSNTGGSLPPTDKDLTHVVKMLLDKNVAQKKVAEITGLPFVICKKLIDKIRRDDKSLKLNRAMRDLSVGSITLERAAEIHNVNPEDLRKKVGGKGKKLSEHDAFMRAFKKSNRSAGAKFGAHMKKLSELIELGEVNAEDVKKILARAEANLGQNRRSIEQWRARFGQVNGEHAK